MVNQNLRDFYRFFIKPHIIYAGLFMTLEIFCHYKSPMINSRIQLEHLIQTERKLAGVDDKVIIDINTDAHEMSVRRLDEEHYRLSFQLGQSTSDLASLRHELFHIADKTPSPINMGQYIYWSEPRAICYSAIRKIQKP